MTTATQNKLVKLTRSKMHSEHSSGTWTYVRELLYSFGQIVTDYSVLIRAAL